MNENRDPEKIVREIKRKTRRKFNAEEKIRIVVAPTYFVPTSNKKSCDTSPSISINP